MAPPAPDVKVVTLIFANKVGEDVNVKRITADGGESRFVMNAEGLEMAAESFAWKRSKRR